MIPMTMIGFSGRSGRLAASPPPDTDCRFWSPSARLLLMLFLLFLFLFLFLLFLLVVVVVGVLLLLLLFLLSM